MLKNCLEDLSLVIEEKQATINCDNLPTVRGNLRELRQLFQNLLSNALKFTSEQAPVITINASQDESDHWLFSTQENGIGIDLHYADKIFQISQRLHYTSEYESTGIGLAICQKVVNSHGGAIWVESELGAGSTFFFTL